jgi:hypothetical protein
MSDIDWTEAPEGTTHYTHHSGAGSRWLRLYDNGMICWFSNCWRPYDKDRTTGRDHLEAATARPSGAWTGAGQPPLHVDIEWRYGDHAWKPGRALYIGSFYAILEASDGEQHYYVRDIQFRPIRTPEQIAAEERQKDVMAIGDILIANRGISTEYHQAGLIYDAGYRKQVKP